MALGDLRSVDLRYSMSVSRTVMSAEKRPSIVDDYGDMIHFGIGLIDVIRIMGKEEAYECRDWVSRS